MGTPLQRLEGHSDWVNSVAFLQGGKVKQGLFVSNDWVIEGKEKILWLPHEYRASSMAVWNKIIVLGHSSWTHLNSYILVSFQIFSEVAWPVMSILNHVEKTNHNLAGEGSSRGGGRQAVD